MAQYYKQQTEEGTLILNYPLEQHYDKIEEEEFILYHAIQPNILVSSLRHGLKTDSAYGPTSQVGLHLTPNLVKAKLYAGEIGIVLACRVKLGRINTGEDKLATDCDSKAITQSEGESCDFIIIHDAGRILPYMIVQNY